MNSHTADVAVIGAGAVGLAVAVELGRAGVAVAVVDRNPAPGMGSTSRANGGVRAQFTTPINVRFSQHTIAELRALDQVSSGRVGFRPIGYLLMTGTAAGERQLRRAQALQRSLGVEVDWLPAADVQQRWPFLRCAGLRGATFCATDGVIDPHGVTAVLADQARRYGATLLLDCTVREVTHQSTGCRVISDSTTLQAGMVINAAGPHAREVAALAGVDLPVLPYRRNLICTQRVADIPDTIPMCVDMDTGVLLRREGDGLLVGYADPHSQPTFATSFEPSFLDDIASRGPRRFPFLRDARIDSRKCWAGLYPETPDHHAIIDAPKSAPWFIQCAGFGGHGIMHCLAAGRAVAELVTHGACTSFDLAPLRIDRFDGQLTVETAVL